MEIRINTIEGKLFTPFNCQINTLIMKERNRMIKPSFPMTPPFIGNEKSFNDNCNKNVSRKIVSRTLSSCSMSSLGSSSGESKTSCNSPLPQINTKSYDPSRVKTEMCLNMESGNCQYAERCHYAHDISELRDTPGRHPKYKTIKCNAFHTDGYCSWGRRCAFKHSSIDADSIFKSLDLWYSMTYLNYSKNFDYDGPERILRSDFDDDLQLIQLKSDPCRLPIFSNICSNV